MTVDVTLWPDRGAIPSGSFRGDADAPFAVLYPLGQGARSAIQTPMSMPATEQARYFRELAEVANRLADELDPQEGAKP